MVFFAVNRNMTAQVRNLLTGTESLKLCILFKIKYFKSETKIEKILT